MEFNLTTKEKEVLKILVLGLSNMQIAKKLKISCATVKVHVQAIFRKLHVKNRVQAAVIASTIEIV